MNFAALFFISLFAIGWVATRLGQAKLFAKANQPAVAAFIPVWREYILVKLTDKPIWWVALLLVPIVNVLAGVALMVEFVKAYDKHSFKEQAAAVLLPFYYNIRIGFDTTTRYIGPSLTLQQGLDKFAEANPAEKTEAERAKSVLQDVIKGKKDKNGNKIAFDSVMRMPVVKRVHEAFHITPHKSGSREWADALLFAGTSAFIIRTFFLEAFMIPTSSMERTLMAGDFLFVSKFHYGVRMPMVPLAVPFVHNKITIGGVHIPTYLDLFHLPYWRVPGFTKVKRNDIVVFNYPAHDVVALRDGSGLVKPTSLKENYIKRCVGIPGDVLQVKDQQLYINGQPANNPPGLQQEYEFIARGTINEKRMNELGFRKLYTLGDEPQPINISWLTDGNVGNNNARFYKMWCPTDVAATISKFDNVDTIARVGAKPTDISENIYPYEHQRDIFKFNMDFYGPLTIPAKGMTVTLDERTYYAYKRVIEGYEGHTSSWSNGQAIVDDKVAKTYTFAQDYYWMMGDNRHNSEDSRVWGFVPEDHIVGTPIFIFFSYESDFGIRFNRIGTGKVK